MGIFSKLFSSKSKETKKTTSTNNQEKETNSSNELIVTSPVNGKVKFLSNVSDPVFAEEMTGKGIAVVPNKEEKTVLSPIKGTIKVAFPTGHAYGIGTEMGPELLVHIGLDTVELDGKGFVKKVEVEEKVTNETELCDIDLKTLEDNDKPTDIIVIATNDSIVDYKIEIEVEDGSEVKIGDPLYKIVKK